MDNNCDQFKEFFKMRREKVEGSVYSYCVCSEDYYHNDGMWGPVPSPHISIIVPLQNIDANSP